jgi:hypothetical protein
LLCPFDRGIGTPPANSPRHDSGIAAVSAFEREHGQEYCTHDQAQNCREEVELEATVRSAHLADQPEEHDEDHRADERSSRSEQVDVLVDATLARTLISDARLYFGGTFRTFAIRSARLVIRHADTPRCSAPTWVLGSASFGAEWIRAGRPGS